MKLKWNTAWVRDRANPVLPPDPGDARESDCCMNPWALRDDDGLLRVYYAGGDQHGQRRICVATAGSAAGPWRRHGPALEPGEAGSFDAAWCVLPHVVRGPDGDFRLYYTGNSGVGRSLDRFPGLGLAVSADGVTFAKNSGSPIIPASHVEGDPDAQGIAGGSVLEVKLDNGEREWRFYYTGCPTLGDDVFLDQQKTICLAVSADGVTWSKRGAVMLRNPRHDYENIAVAGPVVRQRGDGSYQMWYSAIGTRWGYYSICYAESDDGLAWRRGEGYGDNLQLGPTFRSGGWEGQMVEYPSVVDEGDCGLRLFYCGNGYGRTGIGTAVSTPLRATAADDCAHIAGGATGTTWELRVPGSVTIAGRQVTVPTPHWLGPDAACTIWCEAALDTAVAMRTMIEHVADGLRVRVTLMNNGVRDLRDVEISPALRRRDQPGPELRMAWGRIRADLPAGGVRVFDGTVTVRHEEHIASDRNTP